MPTTLFVPLPSVPTPHLDRFATPPGAVVHEPGSEAEIRTAAAQADVVRLRYSAAVPTRPAMRRVVRMVTDALADAGRDRRDVRIVLDLPVVVTEPGTVERRRRDFGQLDALSGLSWTPSATWVVTSADRLVDDALAASADLGVDDVVLVRARR